MGWGAGTPFNYAFKAYTGHSFFSPVATSNGKARNTHRAIVCCFRQFLTLQLVVLSVHILSYFAKGAEVKKK